MFSKIKKNSRYLSFLGIFGYIFCLPYIAGASTYGSTIFTGGTATADSVTGGQIASNAFDGNTGTEWTSDGTGYPHWLKYDLGIGVSKRPAKIGLHNYADGRGNQNKTLELFGSNDNVNYYLITSTTETNYITPSWYYYEFTATTTAYRYFKLNLPDSYINNGYSSANEFEAYECTDCGSAPTISAYTEVCYETATSTSCYRPLDVYKSYGIDGLFILVPLFAFAYFLKNRRKNTIQI